MAKETNWTPADASTGNPFRYTGRRVDPETGLYYYRARYYSPKLGRFLQTDPIGTKDDLNLYVYVQNDPANAGDPTGEERFGINLNFKFAFGRQGFRGSINLNYDAKTKELGGSATYGYRAGYLGAAKVELYREPSSEQGNKMAIRAEGVAEAEVKVKTPVINGDFSVKGTVGAELSSDSGFSTFADVKTTSEGNKGPVSVNAETGRVTLSFGGEAGAAIGGDVTVSGNVSLPESKQEDSPPQKPPCRELNGKTSC